MKKTIIALVMMSLTGLVQAAGMKVHLDEGNIDPSDKSSLQRGAKLFVNYCLN